MPRPTPSPTDWAYSELLEDVEDDVLATAGGALIAEGKNVVAGVFRDGTRVAADVGFELERKSGA